MTESHKELAPSDDFMFSYVLSDNSMSPAVLSLVNAIKTDIHEETFSDIVSVESQSRILGKSAEHKYGVLDVLAKAQNGTLINLEMQVTKDALMDRRLGYYSSALLTDLKGGETYQTMPNTCMIVIEGLKTKSNDDGIYHHAYDMRSKQPPHEPMQDGWIDIHKLSLTTFVKQSGFDPDNRLHWWLAYFGGKYKDKEFVKEAGKMDAGIIQFAEKYSYSLNDPETMRSYDAYKKSQLELNSKIYEERCSIFGGLYEMGESEMKLRRLATKKGMSNEEFNAMFKQIQKTVQRPKSPPTI